MAITGRSVWANEYDRSPGTVNNSTASKAYTKGKLYLAFVTQYNTNSINPDIPTFSGLGVQGNWIDITPTALTSPGLWDTEGASRRRSSVFWGIANSSGTGVATAAYSNQPTAINIAIEEMSGANNVIHVAEGSVLCPQNTLVELPTIQTPASVDNRLSVYVAGNINGLGLAEFETISNGGDIDWVTYGEESGSGSAPTGIFIMGYYDGDPNDDLTPGWINYAAATASAYMYAVEVQPTSVTTGIDQSYFGRFAGFPSPSPEEPSGILIPDSGSWLGTTYNNLASWESTTDRRPHIINFYFTGAHSGTFNSTQLDALRPSGQDNAMPKIQWKINSNGATWATVAAGNRDSDIVTFCTGLKTYPGKILMTLPHHEPEDDVGQSSGYSAADYVGMVQRFRDIADQEEVTNCIYVLNYTGWQSWAQDSVGTGWEELYPGDSYVDWIFFNPYTHTTITDTWGELINRNASGMISWYTWATTYHSNKPLGIGEFGAGQDGNLSGGLTTTQQAGHFDNWSAQIANYPLIQMCVYWNSTGNYDYRTSSMSTAGKAAYKTFTNLSWFTQDISKIEL